MNAHPHRQPQLNPLPHAEFRRATLTRCLLCLLGWSVVGCATTDVVTPGPGGASCPAGSTVDILVGDATVAAGDAEPSDSETSDASAPPGLSPCLSACDQAVACSVQQCAGYNWATAGTLYTRCVDACDAGLEAIDASSSCADATAALAKRLPSYSGDCASNPCDAACDKAASCIVSECEAMAPSAKTDIALSCVKTCTPQTITFVSGVKSCGALVDAIAQGDPSFAKSCHGSGGGGGGSGTCASAALCAPYADKLTACLLANCSAAAKPYEAGLKAALAAYCATDAKCPAVQAVQGIVAPATTCKSPGLNTFGTQAPFDRVCQGTVGVTYAALHASCAALKACPGTDWLASAEVCTALLALRTDTAVRVGCLQKAKDCPARLSCLQGL